MHLMFLTPEFYPTNGGVANATLEMCIAMRKYLRYRICVVVCGRWGGWEKASAYERWNELDVYRIKFTGFPDERPVRQSARTVLCFSRLLYLTIKLRPDAIVSQRMFDLGVFGGVLGRIVGAARLAYAHGVSDIQLAGLVPWRRRFNRLAMTLNDISLTTNSFNANFLRMCNPKATIEILPNIVSHDTSTYDVVSRPTEHGSNVFTIACVGRATVQSGVETKGMSYAIRAMARLKNCHLHIFGDGEYLGELKKMSSDLHLDDRVTFFGKIPREELFEHLTRADVLLHPALIEGLPMIVLEAMRLGIPVIATPIGGLTDIIVHEKTGLQIHAADSNSIVEQIEFAKKNPEVMKEISAAAKKLVESYAEGESVTMKFGLILNTLTHAG